CLPLTFPPAAKSGIRIKQVEMEHLKEQKEILEPIMGKAEQDIETIREQLLVISDIFRSGAVNPTSPPVVSDYNPCSLAYEADSST
ncbi:3184_t:CDS:2, partial [Acaulospora colombiana]